MSKPIRVKLWDAVNDYANACGGDTSKHVGSLARMKSVSAVESAVDDELATLRAENERLQSELSAEKKAHEDDLHDLGVIADIASRVYMHVTNGAISKPNTLAEAICAEADDCSTRAAEEHAEEVTKELRAENERLKGALSKIDAIRNSIIGFQKINWSEHIYPLVAALNEAGFEGKPYEENRKNVGTLIEQINAAEADNERLKGELALVQSRHAHESERATHLVGVAIRVEGKLREAQATIERVRAVAERVANAVDIDAADVYEQLSSALASAKPEPSTEAGITTGEPEPDATLSRLPLDVIREYLAKHDARPGWVAVAVLRAKAEEWRDKSFRRPYDEYGDGKEHGYSEAADEITVIADNAGDAPPSVPVATLLALADELHAHGAKCDPSKTQRAKALWDAERRVREIADNAGDAEAVERAAFEAVQAAMVRHRQTVTLDNYYTKNGALKFSAGDEETVREADSLHAAYRALAGKGGEDKP